MNSNIRKGTWAYLVPGQSGQTLWTKIDKHPDKVARHTASASIAGAAAPRQGGDVARGGLNERDNEHHAFRSIIINLNI